MSRVSHTSAQTLRLLDALSQNPDEWTYGYDLSRTTGLKSGTLYPILMRLSEQGFLQTRWSEPSHPGRPPRHMYRLSPAGIALARDRLQLKTRSRVAMRALAAS